jgi:LPPG:FO 2-phospho-L-lactate transferase
MTSVVALAGGVGAAKLLKGLIYVVPPEKLTVIVNTGDDLELWGLHVSPDIDIIMYTLAGIVDESKGWGIAEDTFHCLNMIGKLGMETWFKIGDKDLAIHLVRTKLLREGYTLSQVATELCKKLRVKAKLIPMTDDPVRTKIKSGKLTLDFQEYFVKRKAMDKVTQLIFEGAEKAKPAPGILEAIEKAERIIICPSNPFLSIAPILSVPGIKEKIKTTHAPIIGISPIIGGKALKGPTAKIMEDQGLNVSAYSVAKFYAELLDYFVIDTVDAHLKDKIEKLGMKVTVTNTWMKSLKDSVKLAEATMRI